VLASASRPRYSQTETFQIGTSTVTDPIAEQAFRLSEPGVTAVRDAAGDAGRLRVALAAPVFAAAGHIGMRTPSMRDASWATVRASVELAEELGYDSVWFSDHLFHGRTGAFHESWTALSIAAGFTDRIRLVNNHLGVGLRDPRVLAKMATTLADATGDRFELFLAAGYRRREYDAYGIEWRADDVRLQQLREAIAVIRALWSGDPVDADGPSYPLHRAIARPTPGGAPFVWIGGPLSDGALDLIAAEADGWNSFPLGLDDYASAAQRVDDACRRNGRDPSTLRRSLETQVLIVDDEDEWHDMLQRWAGLRAAAPLDEFTDDLVSGTVVYDADTVEAVRRQCIIGTRDEVAAIIDRYRALGVTDLVCWFMDLPDERSMRELTALLARQTTPVHGERR